MMMSGHLLIFSSALVLASSAFAQSSSSAGPRVGAPAGASLDASPPLPDAKTSASASTSTSTSTSASADSKALGPDAKPASEAKSLPQEAKPLAQEAKPLRDTTLSITKVVGEVGEQFVTSREVRINSAVEQSLREKPLTTDQGYLIPNPQDRAFSGETARVLDEWAIFFEAKSLGSVTVSKSEVSRVLAAVQERWGTKADWLALEPGADELRFLVERKLAADEFQKLKSDPALSPISDEEALSYYKKNRMRFGTLPFSTFKDNIKQFLVKAQIDRRLSEWHDVLRRKYKTRNFISG